MRDELDRILDKAVKSYTAVELPPEFPAHILRQAQQGPAPRHSRWRFALALALPLAAVLTLGFVFTGRLTLPNAPAPVASQPSTPKVAALTPPQPPETLAAASREPVPVRHYAHPARATRIARSWARPLPAPYSKEELALVAFVEQHPKEAAEIAQAQKRDIAPLHPQPITISPLEIKPLTIAALH